jgi:Tol biopolymer transport system component
VGWTSGAAVLASGLAATPAIAVEFRLLTPDQNNPVVQQDAPAWCADGRRLAFTHRDGATSRVVIVDTTGKRLDTIPDAWSPTWAPDGQLAYATEHGIEIAATQVVPHGTSPHWSSDVRLIAFESNDDIWATTPDGRAMALTQHTAADRAPVWSPDGRKIAYESNRLGSFDIWVLPVFGGYPRRITTDAGDETDVAWSPDERLVAYVTGGDIWLVPSAGGAATRLTEDAATDSAPAWSPDGKQLAFVSDRSGVQRIWIASALPPSEVLLRNWNTVSRHQR